MDENLCGTSLTGSKILSLLSTSPHSHINGHELQNVEATVIGDGQGFTSKVMRIHLKWSPGGVSSGPQPPKSIIIKVIGSKSFGEIFETLGAEEVAKLSNQIRQIHDVECSVYELEELPKLMNLPICYFKARNTAEEPGMIALEDLGDRAVSIPAKQFGIGINKAQLDQLLESLATLHAWSVNTSVDWRRTMLWFKDFEVMPTFFNQLAGMYEKSKETHPEVYENVNDEKLIPYLKFESFLKVFGCDPRTRYDLPVVLVHGDVHFVNTVWEKLEDGTAGDRLAAMIDWQVSHQGCAMEDLTRLLVLSMSIDMRRKYKDYILEKYLELFNSKVKKEENKIKYENAKRAYDEFYAYTAVMWGCSLPMHESFSKQLKNITEEERIVIGKRINDTMIDAFQDARTIFGF